MSFFLKKTPVILLIYGIMFSTFAMAQEASLAGNARYQDEKRIANSTAVSIIVSALGCACARFAEDMRHILNDLKPGGLRILPILSVGGVQNMKDILFLRGVDMGIVQQDNLVALKNTDSVLYANLENRIQYITKLYNAEVHVIAGENIRTLADLEGKAVNFFLKDSPAETTSDNIFRTLKIKVRKTYHDHHEAIALLKSGKIAAAIVMTGAPQSLIRKLKKENGLHFVPIDEESLPGRNVKALLAEYLPAELTSELYPNLVEPGHSVPTIANRALLVTYNWPVNTQRYRRVVNFVNEFFAKFDVFHGRSRHPKWNEVNLAAKVPGWVRFKPAQDWLEGRKEKIASTQTSLVAGSVNNNAFKEFLDNYTTADGRPLNAKDREALILEFKQFINSRVNNSIHR
jgi:TRAP transporter TAXI family solute receptor